MGLIPDTAGPHLPFPLLQEGGWSGISASPFTEHGKQSAQGTEQNFLPFTPAPPEALTT